MKITKKEQENFLKNKLSNDKKWASRALIRIYQFQTEYEKNSQHTYYYNNVGFNGVDSEILTSFAEQFNKRGFLTNKQYKILFNKMPKYWRQLINISDQNMLKNLIEKQRKKDYIEL